MSLPGMAYLMQKEGSNWHLREILFANFISSGLRRVAAKSRLIKLNSWPFSEAMENQI